MLNSNHQITANQSHNETSPHSCEKLLSARGGNKCWQGCGKKGSLVHCWWECKSVQLLWKTVWRFLKKLKIELSYNPAISLLGIYPKEMKTLAQKAIRFVVVRGMGWEKWELDKGGQVNLFNLLSLNRRWC